MKPIFASLLLITLSVAAPNYSKLGFRNLYKQPVSPKLNPRIIGGQEATPHSLPYQAFLIFYSYGGAWFCGGALISQNYVITSAGCGFGTYQVDVTLGAHRPLEVEDTQVTVASVDITVHEYYDSEEFVNDIAVVRLSTSVPLSTVIQVVPLPSQSDASNDFVGALATVSGWGVTDGRGTTMSDALNFVQVTVMTNNDCETFLGFLPLSNLCTSGSNNGGMCSGDVGGPLVTDGILIGVGSWGVPYCVKGFPSAFSRVTSFLDWIGKNTDLVIV